MGKKVLGLIAVFVLLGASTAAAYVDIPVIAAGDGYWHNEILEKVL